MKKNSDKSGGADSFDPEDFFWVQEDVLKTYLIATGQTLEQLLEKLNGTEE